MDLELHGKVALVTGASRGIGAAIARELGGQGVALFLTATSEADLGAVADEVRHSTGAKVGICRADLRSIGSEQNVVGAAASMFGRLDILVNCAGATRSGHVFELADDDWHTAFEVKFHGTLRTSRAAWPHLRAARGCIVNIAGNTARSGRADHAINGAVNAALLNLTKALADLGRRDGVRVNAINPGRFKTRRLATALDRIAREEGTDRQAAADRLLASSGIERFGDPSEIAWLVAYLASSRAAFIQGAIIDIDGGETRAV